MTSEEAIALSESGKIEELTAREKAELQLFQDNLCMPFKDFHKAIDETLRPIWLHEMADAESIRQEWVSKFGKPRSFKHLYSSK